MISVLNVFTGSNEENITEAADTIDLGTENKGQKGRLDGNVQAALDNVLKTALNPTTTADGIPKSNKWTSSPGAVSTGVDNSISQENVKF